MADDKLDNVSDREALLRIKSQLHRLHHDLQTPLSILTGNVELVTALSQDIEVDPAIMQSLHDIHAASLMLTDLLARLEEIRKGVEESF